MNKQNRSYLYGVVGGYLLYLAYELFAARQDTNTTMAPAVRWLFVGLFVAAGIFLLIWATRLWLEARKGQEEEEKPPENPNSMK